MNKKIGCVMAVRNEEKFVRRAIDSLLQQNYPLEMIVVVDDGSDDNTWVEILKIEDERLVKIRRLERIGGEYLTVNPKKAETYNVGFEELEVSNIDFDYILVSGGDVVYPKTYISNLIFEFLCDPKLRVASGSVIGEKGSFDSPRGCGRMFTKDAWYANGLRYDPTSYYWENYMVMNAVIQGFHTRQFDKFSFHHRKVTGGKSSWFEYGRSYRAIWYPFRFVAKNMLKLVKKKDFKNLLKLIIGYSLPKFKVNWGDRKMSIKFNKHFYKQRIKRMLRR